MISNKYDIIGDIHGHSKVLRNLLGDMGYHEDGGVFRNPDRRIILWGISLIAALNRLMR
jgi:hypothetical protein